MRKIWIIGLLTTVLLSSCSSVVSFFESAERVLESGSRLVTTTGDSFQKIKKENPPAKADSSAKKDSI